MERAKLKLTVIFLLALLNVFLLVQVLIQYARSTGYEETGHEQSVVYLTDRGVTLEEDTIPWNSAFQNTKGDPKALLFDPSAVPAEVPVNAWEILPARQPESLLVDFYREMTADGIVCGEILSVTEGYDAEEINGRVVLTPVWEIDTDVGLYRLNCAAGAFKK